MRVIVMMVCMLGCVGCLCRNQVGHGAVRAYVRVQHCDAAVVADVVRECWPSVCSRGEQGRRNVSVSLEGFAVDSVGQTLIIDGSHSDVASILALVERLDVLRSGN
jgi:hypothetical protein